MPELRPHYGARRAFSLACGLGAGTFVYQRRRRGRSITPTPLGTLTVQQAKIVGLIAHAAGVVAMVVFAVYYVAVMCQL